MTEHTVRVRKIIVEDTGVGLRVVALVYYPGLSMEKYIGININENNINIARQRLTFMIKADAAEAYNTTISKIRIEPPISRLLH